MRTAVLADVHGNLPALSAVLAELDRDPVETIVIAGDVVGGPLARESLQRLAARPEPTRWISGNAERETVGAFDGGAVSDGPSGLAAAWSARALDRAWRDRLASWPITVEVDGVLFCHGSPRRDDEVLTRATPDEPLLEALAGADGRLVVGGHTHQQLVRRVDGRVLYANAGSVGMPYEGRTGAFWMVVDEGVPQLRETSYDLEAAFEELRMSGYPDVDEHLRESLLQPVDPDWVTAFFEHEAGRRPHPGEPIGG